MIDQYNRTINYMRISVTDRCNMRCIFCMPDGCEKKLAHTDILSYEEIITIVKASVKQGIVNYKITGGEPLVRKNVCELIANMKKINGVSNVTITTNGILLKSHLDELYGAGIDGINISLSAMSNDKYRQITQVDQWENVLDTIKAVQEKGIMVKVNFVPILEINDLDICKAAELAKDMQVDVRFIEMMPVGNGKSFTYISQEQTMKIIADKFGQLIPCNHKIGNGPAEYFFVKGFKGNIGFISALSHKFCEKCNRVRLTADGMLKLCLNYETGVSLKEVIRGGNPEKLEQIIGRAVYGKPMEHKFNEKNTNEKNANEKNTNEKKINDNNIIDSRLMSQIGG